MTEEASGSWGHALLGQAFSQQLRKAVVWAYRFLLNVPILQHTAFVSEPPFELVETLHIGIAIWLFPWPNSAHSLCLFHTCYFQTYLLNFFQFSVYFPENSNWPGGSKRAFNKVEFHVWVTAQWAMAPHPSCGRKWLPSCQNFTVVTWENTVCKGMHRSEGWYMGWMINIRIMDEWLLLSFIDTL